MDFYFLLLFWQSDNWSLFFIIYENYLLNLRLFGVDLGIKLLKFEKQIISLGKINSDTHA